jgi:hypothetical protein
MALQRDACQVATYTPEMTQQRFLGTVGHVQGLTFDSTLPGGDDAMSCLLQVDPGFRVDAVNTGRTVCVYRNSDLPLWTGQLMEPTPTQDGWQLSAVGNGGLGANFAGYYSAWNLDNPVDQAISRGLPWRHTAAGDSAFPGGWLLQQPDVASFFITDHMNNITSKQGMTWKVARDGTVTVFPIPSGANRLLVCTDPIPRTLYGNLTTIYLKYVVTDDGQGNQTYATTAVFNQAAINQFNAHETYVDITDAGVLTLSEVQATGNYLLTMYTRAAWGGPFTAYAGQIMTMGGVPVDPATERAGNIYRVLVNDAPYGGEVNAGPIEFIGGQYSYDDDSASSSITPFQSYRTDIMSVLSNATTYT